MGHNHISEDVPTCVLATVEINEWMLLLKSEYLPMVQC